MKAMLTMKREPMKSLFVLFLSGALLLAASLADADVTCRRGFFDDVTHCSSSGSRGPLYDQQTPRGGGAQAAPQRPTGAWTCKRGFSDDVRICENSATGKSATCRKGFPGEWTCE